MIGVVFRLTVLFEVVLAAALALGVMAPRWRVWPPPGRNSWQYRSTWTLTTAAMLGLLALGPLDSGSLGFPPWVLLGFGLPLLVGGGALALWAISSLSFRATLGLGGPLVTRGPYRYTRNPQYLGDIACFGGWVLLGNSSRAVGAFVPGALCFVLAALCEEAWLRERMGPEFDRYAASVPRFVLPPGWLRLARPRRPC